MFDGFEAEKDAQARKRWFASAGTSAAVTLALGSVIAVVAGKTVAREPPEEIDVSFRAELEPPPPEATPPPPPPPPPRVKAASAARRPGRPLLEPAKISDTRAEDVADGAAFDPDTVGDGGEHETLPPPPPPPPADPEPVRVPEPVDVPDDVVPPAALAGNRLPAYPDEARRKGLEGVVVLKLAVSEAGDVIQVTVLGGAEPFVSAALAVVRSWRYEPAREAGRATAGTRIVRIPFRIRV
jgi:protein TonB